MAGLKPLSEKRRHAPATVPTSIRATQSRLSVSAKANPQNRNEQRHCNLQSCASMPAITRLR